MAVTCTCNACKGLTPDEHDTREVRIKVTLIEEVTVDVPIGADSHEYIEQVIKDDYSAVDVVDWEEV